LTVCHSEKRRSPIAQLLLGMRHGQQTTQRFPTHWAASRPLSVGGIALRRTSLPALEISRARCGSRRILRTSRLSDAPRPACGSGCHGDWTCPPHSTQHAYDTLRLRLCCKNVVRCSSDGIHLDSANRRNSFHSHEYRRWELNPHMVAHTGF
jgi:hypothetical protein